MTTTPSVKIKANKETKIQRDYLWLLDMGYILKRAYIKRKHILFGMKMYCIEMEKGEFAYKQEIERAIQNDNFEEADRLTKEFEKIKILNF